VKISTIQMLHADAGWRPWSFVKVTTTEGLVGWSECTDSHGSSQGMHGVVRDLEPFLIGQDPRHIERLCAEMYARTKQSPGSIIQKAIGGIENALWDVKGKALGVPVYTLLGGPVRDRIPLYWSHCGTSRVRASKLVNKPAIASYEDIRAFGEEVRASGFRTVKTNLAVLGDHPYVYMPGFAKSSGWPALNADRLILSAADRWVRAMREALGDDIEIAVDLNFNFKTEGYIRVAQILEPYRLLWLEIDSYDPAALRQIKDAVRTPITSCENLYGSRQYRPYFEQYAMDVASIDVVWNGFSGSKKIADLADSYEMNVCPHNYNGHLSTFISAQFCALIPNLRLAEIDVDDVPWREDLFTQVPEIVDGTMVVPTRAGWGTDVNERILTRHPWPK